MTCVNELTTLASQKNPAVAGKIAAFSNRRVQNRRFYCRNRTKKKQRKVAEKNRGRGKIAALPRFQNRSFFGTLR